MTFLESFPLVSKAFALSVTLTLASLFAASIFAECWLAVRELFYAAGKIPGRLAGHVRTHDTIPWLAILSAISGITLTHHGYWLAALPVMGLTAFLLIKWFNRIMAKKVTAKIPILNLTITYNPKKTPY